MPNWTKEQEKAINLPSGNIIISAGAGSGKTAVLTQRIINLIKNGVNINQLLVLTFTNLSANDIKRQIRKAFEQEVNNGNDIFKKQLELLDTSDIGTFDSYVFKIAQRLHHHIKIDSNISIIDQSLLHYQKRKILEEVFENLYQKNDTNFIKLIDDFTLLSDQELLEIIITLYDKMSNIINRHKYLFEFTSCHYNELRIQFYVDAYHFLLDKNVSLFLSTLDNLKNLISNSDYLDHLEKFQSYLISYKNTSDYDEAIRVFRSNNLRMPRVRDCEDEKLIIQNYKNRIRDFLKSYFRFDNLDSIYKSILKLKTYLIGIVKIMLDYDKKLIQFKKSINCYEFSDISRMVIELFTRSTSIAREYKKKYVEIMVDEYQDNNNVQECFIDLISNNNVYVVGDIKQSIYRFRFSNPRIFLNKYTIYKDDPSKGQKIDFKENFRSRQEVVDAVNTIFSPLMDLKLGNADYKNNHQMIFGNKALYPEPDPFYGMEILQYQDGKFNSESEAFIMASEINNLINEKISISKMVDGILTKRPVEFSDIAIIVENKKLFGIYQEILNHFKIPTITTTDEKFIHSNVIYALFNIIKLIYCYQNVEYRMNNFQHSLYAVSRSFIFQINDQDIINALLDYQTSKNINDLINKNAFTNMHLMIRNLSYLKIPLVDLLTQITIDFNFLPNLIKIGDVKLNQNKLFLFIDNFRQISSQKPFGISDFIEYMDYLYENDLDLDLKIEKPDNNAVKILSMHASKGLEYPIVFIPSLYSKFMKDSNRSNFLYDEKFQIITPIVEDGKEFNTILKDVISNREQIHMISEKIRLFYVAVTRAKEKVYLLKPTRAVNKQYFYTDGIIDYSIRNHYNSMLDMINSIDDKLSKYISNRYFNIEISDSYKYKQKIILPIYQNVQDLTITQLKVTKVKQTIPGIDKIFTFNEIQSIKAGKKIHYELENSHVNLQNNYSLLKILEILNIKKDIKHLKFYFEYPFVYFNQDKEIEGIIDLLIISLNKIYIIDYKLKNIDKLNYQQQLKKYYDYIKSKFDLPIFLYLYSIKDEQLQELDFQVSILH